MGELVLGDVGDPPGQLFGLPQCPAPRAPLALAHRSASATAAPGRGPASSIRSATASGTKSRNGRPVGDTLADDCRGHLDLGIAKNFTRSAPGTCQRSAHRLLALRRPLATASAPAQHPLRLPPAGEGPRPVRAQQEHDLVAGAASLPLERLDRVGGPRLVDLGAGRRPTSAPPAASSHIRYRSSPPGSSSISLCGPARRASAGRGRVPAATRPPERDQVAEVRRVERSSKDP